MDQLSAAYSRQVEHWVRAALSRGATSLDDIVATLPGVYPAVALDALQHIAPGRAWTAAEPSDYPPAPRLAGQTPPLPAPHPLDYDWRFHECAAAALLQHIDSYAVPGSSVLLLGTPSLLHATLGTPRPYTPMLLEANPTMIRWFATYAPSASARHCVIGCDPLPSLTGSVVVADPPWYEEAIRVFLSAAALLCSPGGAVLISLPPIGTRPGIAAEWARVRAWAQHVGLELIRRERGVLPYITPPFERSALQMAGVRISERPWRRGDLAIFTRRLAAAPPPPVFAHGEEIWEEVTVGGVRIRLRPTVAGSVDPRLIPLVADHVLPSVSRRDPRRPLVDVWTTGNRVFACRSTSALAALLRAEGAQTAPLAAAEVAAGRTLTATEAAYVAIAYHQVVDLLAVEQAALEGFWKGAGHDEPQHNLTRRSRRRRPG
jgi:hypothetical protein